MLMPHPDTTREKSARLHEAGQTSSSGRKVLSPPPSTYTPGVYKDEDEEYPYIVHIFGTEKRFPKVFAPAFEADKTLQWCLCSRCACHT